MNRFKQIEHEGRHYILEHNSETSYEERRNEAVKTVLVVLCLSLFYVDPKGADEASSIINLKLTAAEAVSSAERNRLRTVIEKRERELGGSTPYHTFFPEGFLAELSTIPTPDIALYLEKSCCFAQRWDEIDLQYLVDIVSDGVEDTRWKRGPLEKARIWALNRLAAMQTPAAQPAGEPARLIRKYYTDLGKHLPSPTLQDLAAEWYSDLSRIGKEGLEYYVTNLHERASNKAEFLACLALLLAEAEEHAHLPGYGYRRHYPLDYLTPERECEIEASGRAALRGVREWHTLASLSPIEQFLDRARKIELWQNERHQLATRKDGHEEWNEEYGVMLLALQRAVPTAKKKLLRAAYTELKRLLPTIKASRPLKWQRLYDDGQPFFSSSLTAAYAYSEFAPLRPTQNTTDQISEFFFQYLHIHLFEKEWHVWQALILLAGALGEAAPPTPETFLEKQIEPTDLALGTPALTSHFAPHLLNYTLPELTALLTALGLVNTRKQATPAATPGAWVGVIYALIDEKRPRLKGSKAAIGRAFSATFGAVVSERAIQTGLGTRESEAEQFKNRALILLNN